MAILTITAASPVAQWWHRQRVQAALSQLEAHLALARAAAISRGRRTALTPLEGRWDQGWRLHLDSNSNGRWDEGEEILAWHELPPDLLVRVNGVMQRYVLFDPSGRPVQAHGAFLAGTFTICAPSSGASMQLVMSATGRVRQERADRSGCD
ncbi:MAG: GspH/FimT family protein [Caldimonas sp.]|uniref:GspH/FimT family protein n=1 Tax=Caldimonas sp. TaxID=2838790 RepID=UPI00391BC9D9